MKKYLSLLVILTLIVFGTTYKLVRAETETEGPGVSEVDETDAPNPVLTPEQEKAYQNQIKERSDERKAIWQGLQDARKNLTEEKQQAWEKFKAEREKAWETMKVERERIKTAAENLREGAKQKMEALKEKVKAEEDAVKAKAEETRLTGRENALTRFDNALARMNEWKDKVGAKLTELEGKGLDVTTAKDFLETAKTKLTEAEKKVAEAKDLLANSTNQLTTEQKTNLRTLAQATQTLLKDAHQALIDSVKSLKEAALTKLEEKKAENPEPENE